MVSQPTNTKKNKKPASWPIFLGVRIADWRCEFSEGIGVVSDAQPPRKIHIVNGSRGQMPVTSQLFLFGMCWWLQAAGEFFPAHQVSVLSLMPEPFAKLPAQSIFERFCRSLPFAANPHTPKSRGFAANGKIRWKRQKAISRSFAKGSDVNETSPQQAAGYLWVRPSKK